MLLYETYCFLPERFLIFNPRVGKTPDTASIEFIKKNVVIKGIKGLAEIKEYTKVIMFIIKITGYFTIEIINGHIGRFIRPKAILVRTKKFIFSYKIKEPIILNFFKNFRDGW